MTSSAPTALAAVNAISDAETAEVAPYSHTALRAAFEASPLGELHVRRDAHPLWSSRLLDALERGTLTIDDLRYVVAQYSLYARSATRHLAALMAICESDFDRARLSVSLLAQGGGLDPSKRLAYRLRVLLTRALGVTALDAIEEDDATRVFIDACHRHCMTSTPLAASAFLSLGIEGIAPRLHEALATGLAKAGVDASAIAFLRDDPESEAASAIEEVMLSYAHLPRWRETCDTAMDLALTLRARFFDSLYEGLRIRRLRGTLNAIQSAETQPIDEEMLRHRGGGERKLLYASRANDGVDFVVERVPLGADVLDARIVRVPPGSRSEEEGHAHETLLHVLRGWGRVVVGEARLEVAMGDTILVPRWSPHRVQNVGEAEMVCLAVTDFHLADKAFIGDARTYRRQT